MTLDVAFVYAGLVLAWYGAGFAVIAPPLAWGGVAAGYWMNRGNPVASRLAGALLAGVVGAAAAQAWNINAVAHPDLDAWALLKLAGEGYAAPLVTALTTHETSAIELAVILYSPLLLGVVLCVLASRYEEGIAGAAGHVRERVAEYRAGRKAARAAAIDKQLAARRERTLSALPAGAAEPLPPMKFASDNAPVAAPPVVRVAAGEPVALPAEMMIDGERRPVLIVIELTAPTANVLRVPRGSFSNVMVGSFYALRIVSELWLPLLVVFLWFFGPALVAYETHQLTNALSDIARSFKPW